MKVLYIFFVVTGLIINFIISYYALKNNGICIKDNIAINMIKVITFILGCKMLDFFVNHKYYIFYDLLQAIYSGYMFYGGCILSICAIIIYCKVEYISLNTILKVTIPNILLLYALCKIGCFFNNCCTGILIIPIQLIESIICFISYFLIQKYSKTQNKAYKACIIFGIIRFTAFLLRSNISIINLWINEFISLLIVLTAMILQNYAKKKKAKIN